MILIFSNNSDPSTTHVCKWLRNLCAEYIVLNPLDITSFCSNFENTWLASGISYNSINVIWYRRHSHYIPEYFMKTPDFYFSQKIQNNISQEKKAISEYIIDLLKDKYWLNSAKTIRVPKISQLNIANKLGIDIPKTILTTSKKDIINFASSVKSMIIKPIDDTLAFSFEDDSFFLTYTTEIDIKKLEEQPNVFFPCLIQEKLEKLYEIRTFYIVSHPPSTS